MKAIEPIINVKKDLFNQKNASNLLKLVRKSLKYNEEERFSAYDLWAENKIPFEAVALMAYRNCEANLRKDYSIFTQKIVECIQVHHY